jgi:hypothetical protein
MCRWGYHCNSPCWLLAPRGPTLPFLMQHTFCFSLSLPTTSRTTDMRTGWLPYRRAQKLLSLLGSVSHSVDACMSERCLTISKFAEDGLVFPTSACGMHCISEPLISRQAVWKQLHLNQGLPAMHNKCSWKRSFARLVVKVKLSLCCIIPKSSEALFPRGWSWPVISI